MACPDQERGWTGPQWLKAHWMPAGPAAERAERSGEGRRGPVSQVQDWARKPVLWAQVDLWPAV